MAEEDWELIEQGQILVPAGMPTVAQIPIPNSGGLTLSFWTNSSRFGNPTIYQDVLLALEQVGIRTPDGTTRGLSTSTIFIQDAAGKRHLRLDYGPRPGGVIDYHWNQKSTHAVFGISDHQPTGRGGQALHRYARVFRHAGRGLVVVGAVLDGVSIYQASNRPRRITEVAGGWAGAWAGCKLGGAAGAWSMGAAGTAIGTVAPGVGNAIGGAGGVAIGGIGGCLGGAFAGYQAGEWAGGELYDLSEDALQWAEDTIFTEIERLSLDEAPVLEAAN